MFPLSYVDDKGQEWECHTDYRQWVRVETLFADKDIPENMKFGIALTLIFPKVPTDALGAVEFVNEFFRCGQPEQSETKKKSKKRSSKRAYDFSFDFGYIYAAFLEFYKIDLYNIPYMHFWQYKWLFDSLHDCKFIEIAGYRAAETDKDTPQYMKDHISKMKELYRLPQYLCIKQLQQRRDVLNG